MIYLVNNMSRLKVNLILECAHRRTSCQVLDVTFGRELPFHTASVPAVRLLCPGIYLFFFFLVLLKNWNKKLIRYHIEEILELLIYCKLGKAVVLPSSIGRTTILQCVQL